MQDLADVAVLLLEISLGSVVLWAPYHSVLVLIVHSFDWEHQPVLIALSNLISLGSLFVAVVVLGLGSVLQSLIDALLRVHDMWQVEWPLVGGRPLILRLIAIGPTNLGILKGRLFCQLVERLLRSVVLLDRAPLEDVVIVELRLCFIVSGVPLLPVVHLDEVWLSFSCLMGFFS